MFNSNNHRADHLYKNEPNAVNHTDIPLWDRVAKVFKYISDGVTHTLTSKSYVDSEITASALSTHIDIVNVEYQIKVKQKFYTIGIHADTTVDYNLPDDANMTPFNIEIAGAIPAYAVLMGIQLRCVDGVTSSGALTSFTAALGTTSGGEEFQTAGTIAAVDDMSQVATMLLTANKSSRSIWISKITPDANWSTLTDGNWEIYITYFDNSNLV